MTNWKLMETINIIILVVAAISLFFPLGFAIIPALSEKVFGLMEWQKILAIAIGYVIYSFKLLVRA